MSETRTEPQSRSDGYDRMKSAAARLPGAGEPPRAQLVTDNGKTRIAAGVVAKIAGFAAREIPGVQAMGGGMTRRMGQLRGMVGAAGGDSRQGVSVEVGEDEAAVDLAIVTWYGQSIVDVSDAIRRNVIDRVQAMTGLRVTEVNINIDDVYVDGDGRRDDDRSDALEADGSR